MRIAYLLVTLLTLLPASGHLVGGGRHPASRIRAPGARADGAAAAPTFESKLRHFAPAADLPALRTEAARLENDLQSAVEEQDFAAAAMLRDDISQLRQKDPAFLASNLRERLEVLVRRESYGEAATTRDQLLVLRRFQPQYQLAGLWKGVYPNHGEATVKIHYEGDTLVAVKMTGDEHVPAGETTFRADLTTPWQEGASVEEIDEEELVGVRVEVVSVGSDGSEQREVERYHGEGRVAARGFQHAHYVPGQLILVEPDTIGFLWQQMGIFVVFNREQDGPGEMMIEQRAVDA
uniref:UVR domain-containing protein n=1 Tax=Emiliania huxleyi TaxID=2903 RepID=A0A7S3X1Q2_EMIHU